MTFWRIHEALIILFTLCPQEEEEQAVLVRSPSSLRTKQQACSSSDTADTHKLSVRSDTSVGMCLKNAHTEQ